MGESWQDPPEGPMAPLEGHGPEDRPPLDGKGSDAGLPKCWLTADDLLDRLVCGSRNVDTAVRGVVQELARNVERA